MKTKANVIVVLIASFVAALSLTSCEFDNVAKSMNEHGLESRSRPMTTRARSTKPSTSSSTTTRIQAIMAALTLR